jgi:hypothetical protein
MEYIMLFGLLVLDIVCIVMVVVYTFSDRNF